MWYAIQFYGICMPLLSQYDLTKNIIMVDITPNTFPNPGVAWHSNFSKNNFLITFKNKPKSKN